MWRYKSVCIFCGSFGVGRDVRYVEAPGEWV